MPPQTLNTTGNQLDPQVMNLAKAIRSTETTGQKDPYSAKGKSGEYGAYQYTKDTWDKDAKQFLGNRYVPLERADKLVQNEVAYKKIESLKNQGYNPAQIAAIWNSGQPEWEGKKGVNKYGVKYDVPKYVDSVTSTYQALKNGQVPPPSSSPSTVGKEEFATPPDNKSFLRKAAEFAFPILEEKERTPLQTVGDIGLSALWFLPGLGPELEAGLRGVGLASKAAKTAGVLGAGALTGYGADVTSKLSEGKTGKEALTPGLGTALGAGTAGILSKVGNKFSQKGIVEALAKDNNAVFGQTKKGANELAESFSRNKNPGSFLAEKGINLKQMIDPETVAYDTKGQAGKLFSDARNLNEILTETLSRIPKSKPVDEIESVLLSKVPKNAPERTEIVKKEMNLLRQQYGDTPSVADLNEWKHREWNLGKFDMAVPSDIRLTHRMIGNVLKTDVEKLAKEGGLKRVDEFNDLMGSHLDAADLLETLHGTKAKGGRLGNLLAERALSTVGGITGFSGLGPLGAIGGLIAGHYGAKVLASLVRFAEGKPIETAILNKIQKEEPEIVRQFVEFARKTPEGLEGLKNQLAQQGIDIFKEIKPKKVLQLNPKSSNPNLIQGLITTGSSRLGTQ